MQRASVKQVKIAGFTLRFSTSEKKQQQHQRCVERPNVRYGWKADIGHANYWCMFENLRFQTRFLRARFKEIGGDCQAAADLLDGCVVPDRFLSLRDAYRLRMIVLAHPLKVGPDIATAAQAFSWFQNPSSVSDRYAKDYCLYIASAVRGDVAARKKFAEELGRLQVKSVYRNALKVT